MFNILNIIEFAAILAFTISGIRLSAAKKFDYFGVLVIGFVTAVGGGTIRDLALGLTPFWMKTPMYLICTFIALPIVVIFKKHLVHLNNTLFIFDTIGLGLFTVVGIQKTLDCGFPFWVAIIMGTITGSAGSIIRDILINEIPLLFRKEIYALASVIGGFVYWLCDSLDFTHGVTEITTAAIVIIVRVLAVKFQICMPLVDPEEKEENG